MNLYAINELRNTICGFTVAVSVATCHVTGRVLPARTRKICIEVSYKRAQNSGVAKWQFLGIWMRHLCQKVPIWGMYSAFRSIISFVLPSVPPEVQNFGTKRSIFRGLVPYISALETPNSGICIIHMGSKTQILGVTV